MAPTPVDWNLYKRDIEQLYKTGRAEDIVIWLRQEKGVQCNIEQVRSALKRWGFRKAYRMPGQSSAPFLHSGNCRSRSQSEDTFCQTYTSVPPPSDSDGKGPFNQAEIVVFEDFGEYKIKTEGPFKGMWVNDGAVRTIEGVDYVAYCVLVPLWGRRV